MSSSSVEYAEFYRMTTATSAILDDIVTFESAKRKLRQLGVDDDLTILEDLQGAANEAEEYCRRTFRQEVTSTVYWTGWGNSLPIPYPPLQSVLSVNYRDTDDNLRAITATDYEAKISTRGMGRIEFPLDYSFPDVNANRQDPVQATIVRGWGSASEIPGLAKVAVRLLALANYDLNPTAREEAHKMLKHLMFRGYPIRMERVTSGIGQQVTQGTIVTVTPEDYRHTQSTPATTWTIAHNRGEEPESVSFVIAGQPAYNTNWSNLDVNTVQVQWATAQSGIAILEFEDS